MEVKAALAAAKVMATKEIMEKEGVKDTHK